MQNDFVWVDPFAEIEKANQRADAQREAGRHDVLSMLEDVGDEDYRRAIYAAVSELAHRDAAHLVASLGLPKRLEQNVSELVELAVRRERDLLMFNTQPAFRAYYQPNGIEFVGTVSERPTSLPVRWSDTPPPLT